MIERAYFKYTNRLKNLVYSILVLVTGVSVEFDGHYLIFYPGQNIISLLSMDLKTSNSLT